jgi:rhamnogalacturonyl hydrolase YesR
MVEESEKDSHFGRTLFFTKNRFENKLWLETLFMSQSNKSLFSPAVY